MLLLISVRAEGVGTWTQIARLRAGHIPTADRNVQFLENIALMNSQERRDRRNKEGREDNKERLRIIKTKGMTVRDKERFIKSCYLTTAVHR